MKLQEYFLCAKKINIMTLFKDFFSSVSVFDASLTNHDACTDVTWTILTISFLPFWALKVVVSLRFHQKYLNLCSENEQQAWNDMRVSN